MEPLNSSDDTYEAHTIGKHLNRSGWESLLDPIHNSTRTMELEHGTNEVETIEQTNETNEPPGNTSGESPKKVRTLLAMNAAKVIK